MKATRLAMLVLAKLHNTVGLEQLGCSESSGDGLVLATGRTDNGN